MKKLYHLLFVGTSTIFFPFIVLAAINPFSYTVNGSIPNITAVGGNYAITYTITSQYPLDRPITASLKSSTSDFTLTNNCKTPLTAGRGCTLVVSFKPKQLGEQSATLFANDMEFTIINTTIKTTVKGNGHFTFEQNGQPITTLNLKANSAGTVSLKNTGNIDITNVKVSNLNQAGFTNVDCPTDTEGKLAPSEYCTFNYQVSAIPKESTFTIVANGKNVDNTPKNLSVHVASVGHFVFQEKNGAIIKNLVIKNGEKGSFFVKNVGGATINAVQMIIPKQLRPIFTGNCLKVSSLKSEDSCLVEYNMPNDSKITSGMIKTSGQGSDNTPTLRIQTSTITINMLNGAHNLLYDYALNGWWSSMNPLTSTKIVVPASQDWNNFAGYYHINYAYGQPDAYNYFTIDAQGVCKVAKSTTMDPGPLMIPSDKDVNITVSNINIGSKEIIASCSYA